MPAIKTQVLIIGSGPAGLSASIYTSRAEIQTILCCGKQPGGQLTITSEVENYPGLYRIEGPDLMSNMISQATQTGVQINYDTIESIDLTSSPFVAVSRNGETVYEADSIIIATGSSAKFLGLESEKYFMGHGVSGCAVCDGYFFKNKEVVVVGGGNSAMEEALHLTKFATKVTIIHRGKEFRGEKILQNRVFSNDKINIVWNSVVEEILGSEENGKKRVHGVNIKNILTNENETVSCSGVFIAIGHKPNSDLFLGQLDIDEDGYIVTNPNSTTTSVEGVFACGDIQDKIFKQAVTAAGSGCMAALECNKYLTFEKK
jgi:thioredoxin reductase (NADPH)